jgi:hypothetical protein
VQAGGAGQHSSSANAASARPCRGCRFSAARRARCAGGWCCRCGRLISAKSASASAPCATRCSSSDSTVGKGTASTVNGPVTRSLFLVFSGWSYSVSLSACAGDGAVHLGLHLLAGGVEGSRRPSGGCQSVSGPVGGQVETALPIPAAPRLFCPRPASGLCVRPRSR